VPALASGAGGEALSSVYCNEVISGVSSLQAVLVERELSSGELAQLELTQIGDEVGVTATSHGTAAWHTRNRREIRLLTLRQKALDRIESVRSAAELLQPPRKPMEDKHQR
jgi:hypothetical protein